MPGKGRRENYVWKPTANPSSQSFQVVVMLVCTAIGLFPVPAMVGPGRITRGDVEAVLEVSWPNNLIRLLSGRSPKGVSDFEWLIVERIYIFGQDRAAEAAECSLRTTASSRALSKS